MKIIAEKDKLMHFKIPACLDNNDQAFQEVVSYVNKEVPSGIIILNGDLGVGKTTFVQSFLREKMKEKSLQVLSPTYPIELLYPEGKVAHLDLYRIQDPRELIGLSFWEYPDWQIFIEWGEKFKEELSPIALTMFFDFDHDTDGRTVLCQK